MIQWRCTQDPDPVNLYNCAIFKYEAFQNFEDTSGRLRTETFGKVLRRQYNTCPGYFGKVWGDLNTDTRRFGLFGTPMKKYPRYRNAQPNAPCSLCSFTYIGQNRFHLMNCVFHDRRIPGLYVVCMVYRLYRRMVAL